MKLDRFELINILKYDTVVANKLTTGERATVHQYIGMKIPIPRDVAEKLDELYSAMKTDRWQAPEIRYRESEGYLLLEYYSINTERWVLLEKKIR